MKKVILITLLLSSCASILPKVSPKEGLNQYAYYDVSGKYSLSREQRILNKNKLVTRTQIYSNHGSVQKPLEKSIMVSQIGTVNESGKRAMVMRPFASEFTVWLEGKKYESKMKLNTKTKSMIIELNSPEKKWTGRTSLPVPKGKQFCFFSQIPDCLYHNFYLTKALEKRGEFLNFFVVWDGYPYLQDQFSGVGSKLFAPASVKFDGTTKGFNKFSVEVEGQTILYHFSKSFDLVRMFWVAQGISIIPPNEEISNEE